MEESVWRHWGFIKGLLENVGRKGHFLVGLGNFRVFEMRKFRNYYKFFKAFRVEETFIREIKEREKSGLNFDIVSDNFLF